MEWQEWFNSVEPTLRSGREVVVPKYLPHPCEVGFTHPWIAEPVGQKDDWVLSLSDGSRLHIHEYNFAMVMHLDNIDPAVSPLNAAWHWGTESASGRMALATSALWFLMKFLGR
jgi:hypothetical protein